MFPVDSQGRIDKGHSNIYGFRIWVDATKDFTEQQWIRGVDRVQKNIREAVKQGNESWPPSYEEFSVYATESKNASQKIFTPSLPEPESARAERKAKGVERMATLKGIFDE